MPDQLLALARTAGMESDADAAADHELPPGDPDRLGENVEQPRRDADGMCLVRPVEQDCELVAAEPGERLLQAVAEERAVGQRGEPVVEGLPRQLLSQANPLGDVPCVQHDSADAAVGPEVGDARFDVPPLAEPVPDPENRLRRLAVRVCRPHDREIVGMDEPVELVPRSCRSSRPTIFATEWLT